MQLLQRFVEHVRDEQLFNISTRLIVAFSGGLDSVVLCHLLHKAGFQFTAAHVNFQLRGEESFRDEEFVQKFCSEYSIPLEVLHADTVTIAESNGESIQQAARNIRYEWFDQLASVHNESRILTAHHADDNIETLLLFFFRGTGIRGMTGIPVRNRNICRPLLCFTRSEIHEYAKDNDLTWVEDSSNSESKYTRNFLRNKIIPLLEEAMPGAKENLLHNIDRFQQVQELYDQSIALHRKRLLENDGKQTRIAILKLLKSSPLSTIIFECLRHFGFSPSQVPEVITLCASANGSYIASSTHRIIRNRKWLIVAPLADTSSTYFTIERDEKEFEFGDAIIELKLIDRTKFQLDTSAATAQLDFSKMRFPLLLRKWKQGDYFYPLGMKKKKKISRFLIDQKLSRPEKEEQWVLESDRKIIWVVGRRIDERFKVTDSTKEVYRIRIRK